MFLLSSACAPVVPKELADARETYRRASAGPATELTPSDLHKAEVALERAEQAFKDDPNAQTTKDLAYVAGLKAEIAEVLALQSQDRRDKKTADDAYQAKQAQIQRDTKTELAGAKIDLANGERQHQKDAESLSAERIARQNAEDKTASADQKTADSEAKNKALELALAKLAAFKEEARGMVLTLSGGVLFVSGQAVLLPAAQTKLDQIAAALVSAGSHSILVEGHTDSNGADNYNLDLSQRRADAVRSYIISRGYPTEQIKSSGMGKTRPIASNGNAEGRANNRRVEIVILPN